MLKTLQPPHFLKSLRVFMVLVSLICTVQAGHSQTIIRNETSRYKATITNQRQGFHKTLKSEVDRAGVIYYFASYGQSLNDETLKRQHWKALGKNVWLLAQYGFRIEINLEATIWDLRKTLSAADRPSIIIWESHGNSNSQSMYDGSSNKIPYDIFLHANKNIYQLVLTPCFGAQMIDLQGQKSKLESAGSVTEDTIRKYRIPRHVHVTSWNDETFARDLDAHFKKWDPYVGYPGYLAVDGLQCVETGAGFQISKVSSGKTWDGESFQEIKYCIQRIIKSKQGLICTRFGQDLDYFYLLSIQANAILQKSSFDSLAECEVAMSGANNHRVCIEDAVYSRMYDTLEGKLLFSISKGERSCQDLMNGSEI